MAQANMSATIVHDGVGTGGTLFEGKKFFVVQRVPSRLRWLELIKSNGGQVMKTEKNVDIIIADHARQDTPAGALSWRYIEVSVRDGSLASEEAHRCGMRATTARVSRVGSSQPTRQGRVPFTEEDDHVLTQWVLRAEGQGIAIKGNELYRQLEGRNPRHTMQSWRDRWIKILQYRPRPAIDNTEEDEAAPPQSPSTIDSRQSPRAIQTPVRVRSPRSSVARSSDRRSSHTNIAMIRSEGGNIFTKKEDALLLAIYGDIENTDEDRVLDAWNTFASQQSSRHTAQEWRNRYTKYIIPKVLAKKQAGILERTASAEIKSANGEPLANNPEVLRPETFSESPSKAQGSEPPDQPSPTGLSKTSRSASPQPFSGESGHEFWNDILTDRGKFESTLSTFAESQDLDINLTPFILGLQISLFELWQQVITFGGSEAVEEANRWPEVARSFSYKDQQEAASRDLQRCYEEILTDYEVTMKSYRQEMDELTLRRESLNDAHDHDHAPQRQISETTWDENEFFDQPALMLPKQESIVSLKRAFPEDPDSKRSVSEVSGQGSKRRRLVGRYKGKGKELEIPSTPEEHLDLHPRVSQQFHGSPLSQSAQNGDNYNAEDEEAAFPIAGRIPQPRFTIEPETQAFGFASQDASEAENQALQFSPELDDNVSASAFFPALQQEKAQPALASSDVKRASAPRPQPESETQKEAMLLQEFITRMTGLGYGEQVIQQALYATSNNYGLAEFTVIEPLSRGLDYPALKGVWDKDDDRSLRKNELRRIKIKHGKQEMAARKKFLGLS